MSEKSSDLNAFENDVMADSTSKDTAEKAVEAAVAEEKASSDKRKKSKYDKKPTKIYGRGYKKKKVKRIILIVIAVILVVLSVYCLGRRNVKTMKTVSDTLHLDKIPFIGAVVEFLPLDELFDMLKIGENVTAAAEENYSVYTVSRRTIQKTLTGTGTLMPLDEYTVTALTQGEIIEDYFEEGDVVEEDQLLMRIDSSNLDTSLERAEKAYEDAVENLNDLKESLEDLNIISEYSGTLQNIAFEPGDDIRAGEVIATVVDRNTMLIDIPFMQSDVYGINVGDTAVLTVDNTFEQIYGRVKEISPDYSINENGVKVTEITISVSNPGVITENLSATAVIGGYFCTGSSNFYYSVNKNIVSEVSGEVARVIKNDGDFINAGELIVVLDSSDVEESIEKAEESVEDAIKDIDDAREAFENYDICAPISGTVVEKNYKKGEKLGSVNGNSVALIYDLSALVFEMNIDELDIDSLSIGQDVKVNSDAKAGMTYQGEVTKISIQGVTSNGTTYYPITVTISDYGQNDGNALKPGMNIDAEIIIKEAVNVLAVPVDAVGRGNRVTVVKNADESKIDSSSERPTVGEFKIPEGVQIPDGAQRPDGVQIPEGMQITDEKTVQNGTQLPSETDRPGVAQTIRQERNGGYTTVPNTVETEVVIVETGISDENYIEIISGLEEGDVVVVQTVTVSGAQGYMGMGINMGAMGGMSGGMGAMGGMPGGMGGGMPGGMSGGMRR